MPIQPELWRASQLVSTLDGVTDVTNDQFDPRIVHLTNGNILVTFTTNQLGSDTRVFGVLYDPLGTVITGPTQLGVQSDHRAMQVTAAPGGGFISVYEDQAPGGATAIMLREYDDDLDVVDTVTVVPAGAGPPFYVNPEVTFAGNRAFVTYEVNNGAGDVDLVGRYYTPSTNTLHPALTVFNGIAGAGEGIEGHSLATLNNDTVVVAWADQDGAPGSNDEIFFRIANIFTGLSATTSVYALGANLNDPHVAALTGGGFVVTWVVGAPGSGNTSVLARLYDSSGSSAGGAFLATPAVAGNLAPVAAPLRDGGFVIVWHDSASQDISGQRFDSAGAKVEPVFDIETDVTVGPAGVDIDIEGLEDGRFAITWTDAPLAGVAPGGGSGNDTDVHMAIWDPRTGPNATPVYTPDDWRVGTAGNDNFLVGNAAVAHGWDGDDVIGGSFAPNDIFGDAGNDTISIYDIDSAEIADGGSGIDTLVVAWGEDGSVYDLGAGTATYDGEIQAITNFENFKGVVIETPGQSAVDDTVFGTDGVNILDGGDGSDAVNGRGGDDRLVLSGSNPGDFDLLNGGDGFGDADDTVAFAEFGSAVYVNLAYSDPTREVWTRDNPALASGAWRAIANLENIEHIAGSAYDDELYGDGGSNDIDGLGGSDLTFGGGGSDRMLLSTSAIGDFDLLDGEGGNDTADFSVFGSAVFANLDYSDPTREVWTRDNPDLASGAWRAIADLSSIENLTGSDFDDALHGDSNLNVFRGGLGDDAVFGRGGNDQFRYTGGFDTYDGGTGDDLVSFLDTDFAVWVDLSYSGAIGTEVWTTGGTTIDFVNWQQIADLTDVENIFGSSFSDIVHDDLGSNFLDTRNGDDLIYLSGGLDDVDGSSGSDTVDFSEYQTAVWVDLDYAGATGYEAWTRNGPDVASGPWTPIADIKDIENLNGSVFSDRLLGDAEKNTLNGGAGHDELVFSEGLDNYFGGAGVDTIDFSDAPFAVWVGLTYNGPEAWTQDDDDLIADPWRPIGELDGIENIVGSAFHDDLRGDTASNRMTGGDGNDRFMFDDNAGSDRITDFQDTGSGFEDVLNFSLNSTINSLADVSISVVSGDTVITGADTVVTLIGVASGVDGDDFVF